MKRFAREYPDGYGPSNFCRSCGVDFTSLDGFDAHRVGDHDLDWPEHEDGRRCADLDELAEKGYRPMSDEELLASPRHAHRVGFGVPLVFDPVAVERARERFAGARA